jgi:chromosome segregation ATPase
MASDAATDASRVSLDVLEERLQAFLARHRTGEGEREGLAARLASLECAYQELLARLRRYESERAEIRSRVERILKLIGRP